MSHDLGGVVERGVEGGALRYGWSSDRAEAPLTQVSPMLRGAALEVDATVKGYMRDITMPFPDALAKNLLEIGNEMWFLRVDLPTRAQV